MEERKNNVIIFIFLLILLIILFAIFCEKYLQGLYLIFIVAFFGIVFFIFSSCKENHFVKEFFAYDPDWHSGAIKDSKTCKNCETKVDKPVEQVEPEKV